MSIRSLDFQMLIPKSQEQSKMNQLTNNKIRTDHYQIVQEEKKNVETKQKKINTFENNNIIYNNDNNSNKRQRSRQDKKKNKDAKNDEKRNEAAPLVGSKIDIKI